MLLLQVKHDNQSKSQKQRRHVETLQPHSQAHVKPPADADEDPVFARVYILRSFINQINVSSNNDTKRT